MKKVCILGAGSWGTAQAVLLSKNVDHIIVWGRAEDNPETIESSRENQRFLPGVRLPDNIKLTSDLAQALEKTELIVLAIPSQSLRSLLETLIPYINSASYLLNTSKGLEISTGMRMSQVMEDVLGNEIKERCAVLSGPSHAEEVAREIPTAVTIAAYRKATAFKLQSIYMTPSFRVYTNPDVAGVELGGALKNVIALGTGIATGLGYGDNTQAALLTRGLHEIIKMGRAMGGDPRTFRGLSGIGDLVVTCGSKHSRNRQAGIMIGQGLSLAETLRNVGMVVEGVHTVKVVYRLAQKYKLDMPISTACYNVLYNDKSPREQVDSLMKRSKKHEIEEIANEDVEW
ncbi:MAG: NAD(P)H-dependent glycerol-3-phosphate dehydrogenase [Syntrophomonadaceae bacterium]|nr:NAD(P)H-dependent glycerol-3-phosphate dehydrogenase [Syntrophomonadaceae bacterium]MDD3024330.1 NAD(P)H-dependent glycerol-3-phosphate dehydrogenase [Syntrophomonadaceae bacterium]